MKATYQKPTRMASEVEAHRDTGGLRADLFHTENPKARTAD